MAQTAPLRSHPLPNLSDAEVMRLIERLRTALDAAARVEISILNGAPRAIASLAVLTSRHPEIDWQDSRLVSGADIVLSDGAEIGFRRGNDGDEIHLWHDGQNALPAEVSATFAWETNRLAALTQTSTTHAVVLGDRITRLKTLQMTIREIPMATDAVSASPVAVRVRSRGSNQDNIAFALTTGIEKPGVNWAYEGLGMILLVAVLFFAGALSILVQ